MPFLLIVGEKEQATDTVSVRKQGGEDKGVMSLDEFVRYMKQEIADELK
jgi:threonyl-tRNA synthetase